jgi:3-hydroxy-9,10-secoandrosta-1,3,5(10)-triene-9,17-dione monooxygenase
MYHLPFGAVFSAAITSATFGIAHGTIDAYREQLKSCVSVSGVVGKSDPFQQEALAEAEADLAAGIVHLDVMTIDMLEQARHGNPMTHSLRLDFRRNQVRAVQRVLHSVDRLLSRAGSAAVWTTRPVERYWRDLRTAATHVCNVTDVVYPPWANHEFTLGHEINAFY